jgi:hypothetical protein
MWRDGWWCSFFGIGFVFHFRCYGGLRKLEFLVGGNGCVGVAIRLECSPPCQGKQEISEVKLLKVLS